jgi:hypothetical protein
MRVSFLKGFKTLAGQGAHSAENRFFYWRSTEMVQRHYEFLAPERLREGSKIRVTEKGMLFNSVDHARTFKTEKLLGVEDLNVRFNGVIYRLDTDTHGLEKCGEYGPYEGMKGALWE